MGILVRLIKAVIGAALLNKAVRNAFIASLIKSVNWILRPSTISRIMAFTIRPNVPYIKISSHTNSSIGGTDGTSR